MKPTVLRKSVLPPHKHRSPVDVGVLRAQLLARITIESLLNEMTDRNALPRFPQPEFQIKTWMTRRPEYDRPLGPSRGPAVRNGCTCTREFAHASVWLDLEQETGEIKWH